MKTFLNLKQYLILFAATLSLTSCLKSDDPDFQIIAAGYINQVVNEHTVGEGEEAEVTKISLFTPILCIHGNDYISSCSVTASSTLMSTRKLDDYGAVWLSEGRPSEKLPTDAITVSATNAEGETASFSFSFTSSIKEMQDKLVAPIRYNSATKKIEFGFNKVGNATEYLVIIRESKNASLYQSAVIESYTETQISDKLELSEDKIPSDLKAGTYELTTVAITGSSSTGYFGIVQEGESISYVKE